jgi:ankyrin repeat protein
MTSLTSLNPLQALEYVVKVSKVTDEKAHHHLVKNSFDVEKTIADIKNCEHIHRIDLGRKLLESIRLADLTGVKMLLMEGVDVNITNIPHINDRSGMSPLMFAILSMDPDISSSMQIVTEMLKTPQLDFDKLDNNNNSALHFAAHIGSKTIVKHILDKSKTHLTTRNVYGMTPYDIARVNDFYTCEKLLEY